MGWGIFCKGPDLREFSNSSESPECFCADLQWEAETLITVTDCWDVAADLRGLLMGTGALLKV